MTAATSVLRGTTRPLSIAPMMQRTDRHFRRLVREISAHTLLYTEMVVTGAVLHGDRERHLGFSEIEHPIALQLGGSDPASLAESARVAADFGYDEVNLNVGCPSDRVQAGTFGACLMLEATLVARCVERMRAAVDLPVTVKHRIGVDDHDSYAHMLGFVDTVASAGCDRFSVHARKAWLKGLSPKENREIPPLRHHDIWQLKRERPDLVVEINGGIRSLAAAAEQLAHVDAVMIGRAAYDDPLMLADADTQLFGAPRAQATPRAVVEAMLPYVEARLAAGDRLVHVTRHMLNLLSGRPGARAWKATLSSAPAGGPEVLLTALERAEAVAETVHKAREAREAS